MKKYSILLLFFAFSLCAKEKGEEISLLPWMEEQIERELSPFKEQRIDKNLLLQIYQNKKSLGVVPVVIKDQKVYSYAPFQACLEKVLEAYEIPDTIFFYYYGAGPTSPVFFEEDGKTYFPPVFAGNKQKEMENVILIFDRMSFNPFTHPHYTLEYAMQASEQHPQWKNRIKKLFWRGQLTDIPFDQLGDPYKQKPLYENFPFLTSPRLSLVKLALTSPHLIDACLLDYELGDQKYWEYAFFSYHHLPYTKHLTSIQDHLLYKYQICLDGMTCTNPGFAWRLNSQSLVFKVDSPNYQWFYKGLIPGEHYILVKEDFSDLIDHLIWAIIHDDEAFAIAKKAKKFSRKVLTKEMFFKYTAKAISRYASLQDLTENDFQEIITLYQKEQQ